MLHPFGHGRHIMNDIAAALIEAGAMLIRLDADLLAIVGLSLFVTLSAVVIACAIGFPLAAALAIARFPGRRFIIALVNALMGIPPVVVGLIVYLMLSRAGPFGILDLLFTPTAMIIAQTIIIVPIVTSIAQQAIETLWLRYHDLFVSLNAPNVWRIKLLLVGARMSLATAALAGFGRAIGEVGAIMIVGGNIEHVTRMLTTAIALETSRGDFAMALALGIILVAMAIVVSISTHYLLRAGRHG